MPDIAEKKLEEIKLLDLIDINVLKRVQNIFSKMTRMAVLITDEEGISLTEGNNFSKICMDYCRRSPEGRKRCEQCDKMGATMVMEQKAPLYYYCHANMIDFAAPIMLNGRMLGSFIGGQVLTHKPNMEDMRRVAREIGADEEEFVQAANEVQIVPVAAIDRAADFMYGYAEILSELAYKAYDAHKMTNAALRASAVKSDFLANMSHEIRTPLNAIIGMTQIALREEMSDVARQHISQVIGSGQMLLTIINDILDYSKIESGKMSLIDNEYTTLSLVQGVIAIIANRIGDKKIELIIDVEPSIPQMLWGDDTRLKQILVNLANNAVKFTNEGCVVIRIGYKWAHSDEIILKCRVQDTGIGIKKEEFDRLFNSFEQLDSKRNREVEGTGLGLAIVKNLVELMGGRVSVESKYGKGSTFSVEVPQKVVDRHACITPFEDCPCVVGLIDNPYIGTELHKDVERIGAQYIWADSEDDVPALIEQSEAKFLFVSEELFTDKLWQYALSQKELTTVRLVAYNNMDYDEVPGVITIRKPLYSMNVAALLKNIKLKDTAEEDTQELDFIAPTADILIVDDNEVNLTVAVGLLEPLRMKMDTAASGKSAIDMMCRKRYDIVFMDHMMPQMDGVETTHLIRQMQPEYKAVPVIALTANAVSGVKELLLKEGMDDFIAKPIEFKVLLAKLKKYLPAEKIEAVTPESVKQEDAEPQTAIDIPCLDTEEALRLLGSSQLFWRVLKDYYRIIDKKCERIKTCEMAEDWDEYCAEVHALKSSSRQIGAKALSEMAKQMEDASREREIERVRASTDELLAEYRRLQEQLTPYCHEEREVSTERISGEQLCSFLKEMQEAWASLDIGTIEDIFSKMDKYLYEGEEKAYFERLGTAIENFDVEEAESIINQWLQLIPSVEGGK
ncbi:MAG: PocR ligand-binding domain-containing protein [Butyrivibrio sp.]|nr:PocR ligand-binding domain-containing protein [Muribaculum sp.]MCM1553051.1 PocR ligand-binding domain-containing protein [Butyrivibrio sp.]